MIHEPIKLFFSTAQRGLKLLRELGQMGTPLVPLYYAKGDSCPWWVMCRWPMYTSLQFEVDCETYWEGGAQIVRPLWRREDCLLSAAGAVGIVLVGAPTTLITNPRPRPPSQPRGWKQAFA